MKKFSIIITTHNRKELFNRAFTSAVNQNFDDYEIVVVNNGDENIKDIVEENKDKREVKLINYNEKRSPTISANIGIKNANGQWICFLDEDDEIMPHYLEELNKNIEPKDCWLLIRGVLKKGNREKLFWGHKEKFFNKNFLLASFRELFKINYIYRWANIIRKNIYEKLGYFDENLSRASDVEFTLRLSLNGYKFKFIKKPLYIFHYTFSPEKMKLNIENYLKIYDKHRDTIEKDREIQAKFFYNLGWYYLKIKEDKQSFQYFKKSFLLKPEFKSFIRMVETNFQLNKKLNLEKFINRISGKFWLEN